MKKRALVVLGLLFGFAFSLWYIGLYLHPQSTIDGQDLAGLSQEELINVLSAHSGGMENQTFVTILGMGGWWVEGDWPLWFAVFFFTSLFAWIAHRVASVLTPERT